MTDAEWNGCTSQEKATVMLALRGKWGSGNPFNSSRQQTKVFYSIVST